MKKGMVFAALILLLLVFSGFGFAQDEADGDDKTINTENIKEKAKDVAGSLDERTEDVLAKEIDIPSSLKWPLRIILGIREEEITLNYFAVLLSVWLMFLIVLYNILRIIPIFRGKWQPLLASILLNILLSTLGTMRSISIFFLNLGNAFVWLEKLGPFQILIFIAIMFLIAYVTRIVTSFISKKSLLQKAEERGMNAAAGMKQAEALNKASEGAE
jgi:Na+-transporting methylmalonyl-CoA/oxaloacetate decarboxylase gamma subunit